MELSGGAIGLPSKTESQVHYAEALKMSAFHIYTYITGNETLRREATGTVLTRHGVETVVP